MFFGDFFVSVKRKPNLISEIIRGDIREVDMTKRDVLSIALKVIGFASLVLSIAGIPYLWMIAGTPSMSSRNFNLYGQVGSIVLFAAIAFWFIAAADSLSQKVIKDDKSIAFPKSLGSRKVFDLALKVMGVIFSVQGLGLLARLIGGRLFDAAAPRLSYVYWSNFLEFIIYLGIGGYLLLCSSKLAALFYRQPPAVRGEADE